MKDSEGLWARYVEYMRDDLDRTEGTIKLYSYRRRWLEKWCGKPLHEIDTADLRRVKKQACPRYSSSHIKGVFVVARSFDKWGARVEGLWEPKGLEAVPPPREENTSTPPLPLDKAAVLLEACERPLDYKLVYYGLYAGTRIGESAALTSDNWQDDWLIFRGLKTRRTREVPIHPELERVKHLVAAWRPSHPANLQKRKRKLEDRVGFPFVAHQLRKTFSTYLHDQGVSDLCRRDLLGHTTGLDGIYTQVSRREKQEAIASLDYGVFTPPVKRPEPKSQEPKPQARRLTVVPSTKEPDVVTKEPVLENTDPLVGLELSFGEGHRAVRATGRGSGTRYVFDLDCFSWHLAGGGGLAAKTNCGHRVRGVTDETAALLMSERIKEGATMTWCGCLNPEDLPEMAPPSRITKLIDQMGA